VDYTPRFNFVFAKPIQMKYFRNTGVILLMIYGLSCQSQNAKTSTERNDQDDCCKNEAPVKDSTKTSLTMKTIITRKEIACKLTAPEMQQRKAEVLASLKGKVLEKQSLQNGYKYKFESSDSLIDELVSFIKTERLCCDFFTFSLLISDDEGFAWLSITGPKGAKPFIEMEMDL